MLCTAPYSSAAVVNHTYTGSVTSWTQNPIGIMPDTTISLSIDYDEAWITPKYSYNNQWYNVINIIDYYDLGGRLTLNIGGLSYAELYSENPVPTSDPTLGGWYNSIPYIIFDNNNNPIGFASHWLDADWVNYSWDSQINANDSNNISISFVDYANGSTQGVLSAQINFSPVPLPSSIWLFSSALLGSLGITRKKPSRSNDFT